ncbi:MAG: hypothetical protein EB127_14920, partial [Alphaproteobacteria bacterium]|nr:hypothetical protein [Alphaproteobacteria bacterium]
MLNDNNKSFIKGGLHNLGQTCAVNSLIQIIAHTPILCTLITTAYKEYSVDFNTVTWHLGDVIDKVYFNRSDVVAAGLMKILHSAFPNDIHYAEQHDIGELWMLLSSKIAEEIEHVHKYKIDECDELNSRTMHILDDYNLDVTNRIHAAIQTTYK